MAPPVISPTAKSTISDAFTKLEATVAAGDLQTLKEMKTIEQVRDAALKIEAQLAARQKLRNLRRLLPLFQGMEHYAKVVDILCNGTPFLPWVWAPITLILRISSEHLEAFDRILGSYAEIADTLKRFVVLDKRFSRDQDFQETAAVFYADILEFHKHAYKFVTRKSWQLLFQTSWHRFQRRFDSIISDLKRHEALIDKLAQAIHIAEGQQMRDDNDKMLKEIRRWREESAEELIRSEEEQGIKQFNSIVAWLKVNESDQITIFDQLLEESTRYNADTCGWVLSNPKMQSSLQRQPNVPLLWIQGAAGTGKSVLSASIVNFMKKAGYLVISHFCNYAYPSSAKYDHILRSLVLQLVRADEDLVAHVYENYILAKKVASAPLMERLLQLLLANISKKPQETTFVWIVLDGVDECDPLTQNKLFRLISQVTARNFSPDTVVAKALVSCRFSATASAKLSKKQSISLAEEKQHMNHAIRSYTRERFKQDICAKFSEMHLTTSDAEEVENAITQKADGSSPPIHPTRSCEKGANHEVGMFLYARLVLDYLSSNIFYEPDEIKRSVYELPAKLSEFKIMTQILVRLDSRSVDRVKCALGWIAFSKRPLQKVELQSALAFSLGDVSVKNIAPQDLLDKCATLIEERPDSRLGFVHVSVKEFLQSSASNLILVERECLLQHGIATVTCLLAGIESFSDGVPDDPVLVRIIRGLHGFHIYAKEHWTDYLLSLVPSDEEAGSLDCQLFSLACDLAKRLNQLSANPGHLPDKLDDLLVEEEQTPKKPADERIGSLSSPLLQSVVDSCLKARSLEQLELKLKQMESRGQPVDDTAPSAIPPPQEGVSLILERYQTAIRYLLDQADYPGIAAAELDAFKRQFRDSAYTCRVRRCPRAISGFEHRAQCSEHELLHVRTLPCRYPGCQSPAFMSSKHLKRHIDREHAKPETPRTIRKVGILPPRERLEHQAPQQSGLAPLSLPSRNNNSQSTESHVDEATLEGLKAAIRRLPTFPGKPRGPGPISAGVPILNRSQLAVLGAVWRSAYEKHLIQSLDDVQKVQLEGMFLKASLRKSPMDALKNIFISTLSELDADSTAKLDALILSVTMDPHDHSKFETMMGVMGLGPNKDKTYAGSPVPQLTIIPGPSSSHYDIEQHSNVFTHPMSSAMAAPDNSHVPLQDGRPKWSPITKHALNDSPPYVSLQAREKLGQLWTHQITPEMFNQVIDEAKIQALKEPPNSVRNAQPQSRHQNLGAGISQSPLQQGVAAGIGSFSISDAIDHRSKEYGVSEDQEPDLISIPDDIEAHVEQTTFYAPPDLDESMTIQYIETIRTRYQHVLVSMDDAAKKVKEIEAGLKENSAGKPWAAGFDLKLMLDTKREMESRYESFSRAVQNIRTDQNGLRAQHEENFMKRYRS
ncbi:hypothetical protein PG985_016095 [Apiospora marii]|uniref:uncharacterized protein n=1 Tax=Apiospora marii TaxID=335849 RepID=UPI00312EF6B3